MSSQIERRTFLQVAGSAAAVALLPNELRAQPVRQALPFFASYFNFNFSQLFKSLKTNAKRERAIDEALDRHRASGVTTVMPYITSTSGEAAYPSRIVNQLRYPDWDPLAYLIAAADKRELDVYPVFCMLACGNDKPEGILSEHPEWALRKLDGKPMGYLCPTNSAARHWVTSVVEEVVERYPVQGVLLDYLRYYNRPTLLDADSETKLAALKAKQPAGSDKQLTQQYREAGLTALAKQISDTIRSQRPELKIAIYSWGPHVASDHQVAQAWPVWSREGYVNNVNISGYCYPDNYGEKYLDVFSQRIRDAVRLNQKIRGLAQITTCLGIETSHGKIQSASWIDDYLTRAANEGATGATLFKWSSLEPYLEEVNRRGYFDKFMKSMTAKRVE